MNGWNVVYTDIDGVHNNPTIEFLEKLNRRIGTHYKITDVTEFNYRDCFPMKHALIIEEMWADPTLYDDMEPYPRGVQAIQEMREFARVIALSTPTIGHTDSKLRYLTRPPLSFSKNDIIITSDKSLMRGAVLIDDYIKNLLSFSGARICYARPWNKKWDKRLGLRTNRWPKIVEAVRAIILANTREEEEE